MPDMMKKKMSNLGFGDRDFAFGKAIFKCVVLCVLFLEILVPFSLQAQNDSVTLTFTCRTTAGEFVQPDSITVVNVDRNWKETLYYPDTIYHLVVRDDEDDVPLHTSGCSLVATPNPFYGTTTVTLALEEPGTAVLEITDLAGRVIEMSHATFLSAGIQSLRVSLSSPGVYLLVARIGRKTLSCKMMNTGAGDENTIEYGGMIEANPGTFLQRKSFPKATSSHPFQLGDQMRYVAHASWRNSKAVTREQAESEDLTLVLPAFCTSTSQHPAQTDSSFHGNGYNGADDGLETVVNGRIVSVTDYEGNEYPVVRIGSQCWTARNMRCTHSPKGYLTFGGNQTSNVYPYYYSYSAPAFPSDELGVLYNWVGAMDTTMSVSASFSTRRGICPKGWHVPSDANWTTLVNYLGGQADYWCGDTNVNTAKALACTKYWQYVNNGDVCAVGNAMVDNNATGFSAFPAGVVNESGVYGSVQHLANFWSSSSYVSSSAYLYYMRFSDSGLYRYIGGKIKGNSVRCIRN